MGIVKIAISFFSRTITIIIAVITACCILAAYINPNLFWPISIFGLIFPFFIILNAMFLLVWIGRKKWFLVVPLIIFLFGLPQTKNIFGFHLFPASKKTLEKPLKVMTYNVRNFDLYNWDQNTKSKEKIYQTLKAENPDIICFQEFYSDQSENFNNIQQLKKMGYKYYKFSVELRLRKTEEWGIAIFSKFPIQQDGFFMKSKFPTVYNFYPYRGVYADIIYQSKKIRIVTTHLQSIYLQTDDYELINNVKKEKDMNSLQKASGIVFKLKKAFQRRANQAIELNEFLNSNTELPVILCGDFNDTPSSFSYYVGTKGFKDAFISSGFGIGRTYNGPIPALRIDFIMYKAPLSPLRTRVIKNPVSDHFPVVSEFEWQKED